MIIDENIISETNEILKDLFLSMDKDSKNILLKRILKFDIDNAPHRVERLTAAEADLISSFVKETPLRRMTLKKFNPDKIDLPLLILKSYFILEFSLYSLLKCHIYTRSASSPALQALRFGLSCFEDKSEYNLAQIFANPLSSYTGTFFFEHYPYDEALGLFLK